LLSKNNNSKKKLKISLELLSKQGQPQTETKLTGRELGSELCVVGRETTQSNQVLLFSILSHGLSCSVLSSIPCNKGGEEKRLQVLIKMKNEGDREMEP